MEKGKLLKKIAPLSLIVILATGVLSLVCIVHPVKGGTIAVPDDYATIQEAINAASEGDTIFVKSGMYSHIVIDKSVNLVGEDRYTTIIDGSSYEEAAILVVANSVKISNFTIQNGKPDIYVGNRQPVLTANITIADNIIKDSQEGVIRLVCTSGSVLMRNFINGTGAGGGINFDWGNDTLVFNNTVMQCWAAINGGYPSYNNTFQNNNFIDNTYSINMNNVFDESGFFHNNFVNSPLAHLTSSETCAWDDGYPSGGNYWNDYSGTDSDGDGMGDTPYVIDSSNQDNYPLMTPWVPPDVSVLAVSSFIRIPPVTVLRTIFPKPPPSFEININVTVQNNGNKAEGFNVTAYANNTITDASTYVVLASGESTVLTFMLNTTNLALGNYTVWAEASRLSGELDVSDNQLVNGWIFVSIPGDINGDEKVDLKDVFTVAKAYGSVVGDQRYDPNLDINGDGKIDLRDYFTACKNYGIS